MQHTLLAPERVHTELAKQKPMLPYHPGMGWQSTAYSRLQKLLFGEERPERIDLQPALVRRTATQERVQKFHIRFRSEPEAEVVGRLLMPRDAVNAPLIICLQGHSPGMHVSYGEVHAGDEEFAKTYAGLDYALQAVKQGFAALALEQRGFGVRRDARPPAEARYGGRCHNPAMVPLLYGRTLIGERVHDVRAAIDAVSSLAREQHLPLDLARIACIGHSGGGTVAYYAGCLEPRITAVLTAGSVCQFDRSIAAIDHCVCNYIPHIRRWFEMGDIGCLIAPRPLTMVHGKNDAIFPIEGAREAADTLRRAYADQGASERFLFALGNAGHDFYPELAWPAFRQATGW